MSQAQLVKTKTKTKTKQAFQADEVQDELLEVVDFLQTLNEDQVNFILAQYLKNKALEKQKTKSKKVVLPAHIRQGIKESLENYKNGEYVVFEADEEFNLENVEKKLAQLESGVKQKPINLN